MEEYIATITGEVVGGKRLGRTIGFPTANIHIDEELPLTNGVYASSVEIEGHSYAAISNLGNSPSVGGRRRRLETHIFDWKGDLYGREITVILRRFIRAERKFDSIDALRAQIAADVESVANL